MLVAHDKDGNRIYAQTAGRYRECFCPECGMPLIHKKGAIKRPYFAHKVDNSCPYGRDKDSKGEWHIRMQEHFPPECLEVRFKDQFTGEVHIADVFIEQKNMVIEFQCSPISPKEFASRTMFHLQEGRRIVWIFNEKGKNPDSEFGKLQQEKHCRLMWPFYDELSFKWPRMPRKMLSCIKSDDGSPVLQNERYSVCVDYAENDTVHRIVKAYEFDYSEIELSVHTIRVSGDMDVDEFFFPEEHWLKEPPYRDQYLAIIRNQEEKEKARNDADRKAINKAFDKLLRRKW